MNKLNRLREFMNKEGLDAVNIRSLHNIFYFSNFTGTTAQLLITSKAAYFLTDFRYIEQAKAEAVGFEVLDIAETNGYEATIKMLLKRNKAHNIGLEGDFVSRNDWLNIEKSLHVALKDVNLEFLREVKSSEEIKKIQQAIDVAEEALEYIYKNIKVGMSEREVALMLEMYMKERGASDLSFSTIVASGKRGALPHGVASDKVIESGDFITIDFGCIVDGYCSDITRTFAIGENYDPKLKEIYDIVLEANLIGHKNVKAGIKASDVDKAVRDFISDSGYGKNFGHGLGHGLGVLVHEEPRLSPADDSILEEGQVVTIEPGIYIEGLGGVRIEDDVVVTKDGCHSLTSTPKEFRVIEEEE